MNAQPKQTTKQWQAWAAQVNANYHDGGYSEADAEAMAGPEPIKYERDLARHLSEADRTEMFEKGYSIYSFVCDFPHASKRMIENLTND